MTTHSAPAPETDAASEPLQTLRRSKKWGPFWALSYPNFRYFWFSQIVQSEGQWMEQLAQGYLIYAMTNDPFTLGLYGAMRSLPAFIFALPAGVLSDRVNRIRLIQGLQLAAMLITGSFGILVQSGLVTVWMILLFGFVNGAVETTRGPSRQSLLSNIVPSMVILNAVAINEVAQYTMRIAGPVLAGLLITLFGDNLYGGVAAVFYLRSFLYLFAVICTGMIKVTSNQTLARSRSVMNNVGETFGYLKGMPLVLSMVLIGLGPAMVGQPYQYLLPVFAKDIYHVDAIGLGWLTASAGGGAVLGALLLTVLGNVQRMGWLLLTSLFTYGLMLTLFGMATEFPIAMLCLMLVGASQANFQAMRQTIIQLIVRDDLRGRVFSIAQLTRGTLSPVGAVAAGTLAGLVSAPIALLALGGVLMTLSTTYVLFNRGVRSLKFETARQVHE